MDRPKLAELKCSKIHFGPGDRLLVRMKRPLSAKQTREILKSIEKWAGDGVPVLFIPEDLLELQIDKTIRHSS